MQRDTNLCRGRAARTRDDIKWLGNHNNTWAVQWWAQEVKESEGSLLPSVADGECFWFGGKLSIDLIEIELKDKFQTELENSGFGIRNYRRRMPPQGMDAWSIYGFCGRGNAKNYLWVWNCFKANFPRTFRIFERL